MHNKTLEKRETIFWKKTSAKKKTNKRKEVTIHLLCFKITFN